MLLDAALFAGLLAGLLGGSHNFVHLLTMRRQGSVTIPFQDPMGVIVRLDQVIRKELHHRRRVQSGGALVYFPNQISWKKLFPVVVTIGPGGVVLEGPAWTLRKLVKRLYRD
jgi:hypothetical protein